MNRLRYEVGFISDFALRARALSGGQHDPRSLNSYGFGGGLIRLVVSSLDCLWDGFGP